MAGHRQDRREDLGGLGRFGRKAVEVFSRRVPGEVRSEESTGQKERLVVFLAEEIGRPIRQFGVGGLVVFGVDGAPVEMRGARDPVDRPVRRQDTLLEIIVVVPNGLVVLRAVEGFASAHDLVARLAEILRHRDGIGETVAPKIGVAVNGRSRRPDAAKQARAGGVASRRLTVSVAKQNAAACQAVDIGSDRLRVAA